MKIHSERFGNIEVDDSDALQFPEGIVGFPTERSFVLLRHRENSPIAWLQSVVTPELAFPVVSIEALAIDRPYPGVTKPYDEANPHAVMAVLCAPAGGQATVNLLAPIVVNAVTRVGAQVFLEDATFSTTEPFALRQHQQPTRPAEASVFASAAAVAAAP
jgi:flagellar assembly factor FliW